MTLEFKQTGVFVACMAAEQWCRDNGFSVGYMERNSPRGILHGDYAISKWRNLSPVQRKALHGTMTGDMRNGPVFIELTDAPAALLALAQNAPGCLVEAIREAREANNG
jgi:hypothetical protein